MKHMKHAVWIPAWLGLLAGPALSGDDAATAAARDFALAALPGQCDDRASYGEGQDFTDTAIPVSWKPSWDGEDEHGTLYRLFCIAGAYNLVHVYVFKPDNGEMSVVSFAQPTYDIAYAEGDELQTELKGPPKVTGFLATSTLVNSDFDASTNTLFSSAKWRGLGDAWSAGTWQLRDGQFVLESYVIDPIYEINLDNPSEELIDTYFKIYP